MTSITFLIWALAALVPMILGFIWYHPKVLGNVWMNASGLKAEDLKGSNMPLILGLCLVFSYILAAGVHFTVIHQSHVFSILVDEPGFKNQSGEAWNIFETFMGKYGANFRTFKHGLFHGVLDGFLFALPIIAINALFERKGFKYIAVNTGYWIVTIGLMGGIICQFA